jgi:co-chaperonin GroES (HSP10)
VRVKPLGNQIVGKVIPRTMTEGGLHIPNRAQEQANGDHFGRMRVLAVGPGMWGSDGSRQVPDVQVGDVVLIPFSANPRAVEVDSEVYVLIDAHSAHAILLPETASEEVPS